MSVIDSSIKNEAVIPSIETDIFDVNDVARFAVGILAIGDQVIPGREAEFTGYLHLRAKVYAEQTNIISKDLVQEDGTEYDEDDSRSIHFAIIENAASNSRVVAAMRLIIKSNEDDRELPVEDFFPDTFSEPAPIGSIEVSRYICRHEDDKVQNQLKWPLFAKGLSYVMSHSLRPTYGVVEEPLERALIKAGVPIERIAETKYVKEYASDNLAVEIDTANLADNMGLTKQSDIDAILTDTNKFIYFGEREERDEQIGIAA